MIFPSERQEVSLCLSESLRPVFWELPKLLTIVADGKENKKRGKNRLWHAWLEKTKMVDEDKTKADK